MNGVPQNQREELISELECLGFDAERDDDWRTIMTDGELRIAIDNAAEAAWVAHQERLMETGGPDDSAYRRDMINAGRGHLVGGA